MTWHGLDGDVASVEFRSDLEYLGFTLEPCRSFADGWLLEASRTCEARGRFGQMSRNLRDFVLESRAFWSVATCSSADSLKVGGDGRLRHIGGPCLIWRYCSRYCKVTHASELKDQGSSRVCIASPAKDHYHRDLDNQDI